MTDRRAQEAEMANHACRPRRPVRMLVATKTCAVRDETGKLEPVLEGVTRIVASHRWARSLPGLFRPDPLEARKTNRREPWRV
jgi:hypothetical protein